MELIPAIDLRAGRCVRLYQGDYDRETVFSEDPVQMAEHWIGLGATRLHVVDLDGARAGEPKNLDVVESIAALGSVPVQFGGGVRTAADAERVAATGVARIILGTAAVEDSALLKELCRTLGPDSIIAGVDARDGFVATRGWTAASRVTAADLIERVGDLGVKRVIYTDISRDGTMSEPNFAAIEALVGPATPKLIAAGGIATVDHLVRLAGAGLEGAVIGTALYTGGIDFARALETMGTLGRAASSRQ